MKKCFQACPELFFFWFPLLRCRGGGRAEASGNFFGVQGGVLWKWFR